LVFTVSLLDFQHKRYSVENKPASSLLVFLGKALDGCLYVCVVKHVVTGGTLTRIPDKGHVSARASAEKFPEGPTEKIPENSKNNRKIALLSLFQEGRGQRKKDRK